MALSTGMFADGAATYDGKEFRQFVEMLVNGRTGFLGASTSMQASAQSVPDMTVKVAAGAAILDATGAGLFGNFAVANDADLTSPTFTVPGGSVRTDRLVLRVTGQTAALEVIAGTGGSATPPAVTGDNVIKICRVEFAGGETTITSGKIVDEREFLGGGVFVCLSTAKPSTPFEGMAIWLTDTNVLELYDGAAWRQVSQFGAHTSYTPTDTDITVGAGSRTAVYRLTDPKTCRVNWNFTLGVGSSFGATPSIGLPFTSAARRQIMSCVYGETGVRYWDGFVVVEASSAVGRLVNPVTGAVITNAAPFGWNGGDADYVAVSGVYEIA